VRKNAGYDVLDPKKVDFDSKRYSQASKEAESLKIDGFDTVDRLFLERVIVKTGASLHTHAPLIDDLTKIVSSKEIKL
jgi:hypothetical protein